METKYKIEILKDHNKGKRHSLSKGEVKIVGKQTADILVERKIAKVVEEVNPPKR